MEQHFAHIQTTDGEKLATVVLHGPLPACYEWEQRHFAYVKGSKEAGYVVYSETSNGKRTLDR